MVLQNRMHQADKSHVVYLAAANFLQRKSCVEPPYVTRCDFTIWITFCAVLFLLILLWIMFCLYRGISHCETFLLCKKEDYSCLLGKTSKANKLYSSDWCRI